MSFTVWRDVWISAAAQAVSGAGTFLITVALLIAFQGQGEGGLAVAALSIAAAVPSVLLAPLTGRMADRFDSRALLIIAGSVQVTAALALSFAAGVVAQIGLVALLYAGTAIAAPVRSALLPAMARREDLPRVSAVGQSASSVGIMVGPALAGFAIDAVGLVATLRWASLAYLGTIIGGMALRTRRGGSVAGQGATMAGPKPRMDGLLRIVMVGFGVVIGAVSAVNVVDVFFVRGTLGASASTYGVISSLWTVGMLGGAWLIARMIRSASDDGAIVRWLFAGLFATSAVIAAMAGVPGASWLVPLMLVGGSLNGLENVVASTLLARRSAPEARGRFAATLQATVQGMGLAGYVAGGILIDLASPRSILVGAGLAGMVAVVAVTPWVARAIRTAQTEPAATPGHAMGENVLPEAARGHVMAHNVPEGGEVAEVAEVALATR